MNTAAIRLVHTNFRHSMFKQARLNFDSVPKPANLHYLADHLRSAELQDLYKWNPGDVGIYVLERNEARMVRNVHECAFGTFHDRSSFSDFVGDFAALPSGTCPPERDHHFVGAQLSFRGATTSELRALLTFFADDRFVKAGFGTAVAIKVEFPAAPEHTLSRAIRKTLDEVQEDAWPIASSKMADYFAALISDIHPSLEVKIMASEDGERTRAGCRSSRSLLQVVKHEASTQLARQPDNLSSFMGDGTIKVGRVYLPAGKGAKLESRTIPKIMQPFDR